MRKIFLILFGLFLNFLFADIYQASVGNGKFCYESHIYNFKEELYVDIYSEACNYDIVYYDINSKDIRPGKIMEIYDYNASKYRKVKVERMIMNKDGIGVEKYFVLHDLKTNEKLHFSNLQINNSKDLNLPPKPINKKYIIYGILFLLLIFVIFKK